jgi:starch-binding outer membrane protein, SusD/RagB family
MKKINIFLVVLGIGVLFSCQDFLEKEPLGSETDQNYFNSETNAVLAINGIYDVLSWDEGPGNFGVYVPHNYEFFYGDILSDDAAKGSTRSDFPELAELEGWRATATNGSVYGTWHNNFTGIARANTAILNLPDATIDEELKNRLLGEAKFLRAYFYFYQVRLFGGVPKFEEPVKPSEFGSVPRATIAEIYDLIERDLSDAIELLPAKSAYAAADLGRATKGAAQAYMARAIMYQIGTDNTHGHTWEEVKKYANDVISSGEYALHPNYAELFEDEGENGVESIFEVQNLETTDEWGAIKTGSTANIFQNNRSTWGWGFNNPTQDLVDEFEAGDPRKACTVYTDGDVVLGAVQSVVYPDDNETGYLNRKAALVKPATTKAAGQNQRKMRYADVLLMNAEASYHTNDEPTARIMLNLIRDRARVSTKPKGAVEGTLTYEPYGAGELPDLLSITALVTGDALLEAIYHERRVEFAMEGLRFWDQVRTGRYFDSLLPEVKVKAEAKSISNGVVNKIPLMPIPLEEQQTWHLLPNEGY